MMFLENWNGARKLQNVVKRKMAMTMQNGMILKNRNGVRKLQNVLHHIQNYQAKKLVNLTILIHLYRGLLGLLELGGMQLGGILLGAAFVPNPWNERLNVLEKRRESLLVHHELMFPSAVWRVGGWIFPGDVWGIRKRPNVLECEVFDPSAAANAVANPQNS